LNCRSS